LMMFEDRVLRRTYGYKREEGIANRKLRNVYSRPNIVMVIKSKIIRWSKHLAFTEEARGAHKIWVRIPEGTGFTWHRIGTSGSR